MSARARIKSYIVPALERGLRVLELFDRHRSDISAPEVVRGFDYLARLSFGFCGRSNSWAM